MGFVMSNPSKNIFLLILFVFERATMHYFALKKMKEKIKTNL